MFDEFLGSLQKANQSSLNLRRITFVSQASFNLEDTFCKAAQTQVPCSLVRTFDVVRGKDGCTDQRPRRLLPDAFKDLVHLPLRGFLKQKHMRQPRKLKLLKPTKIFQYTKIK